MMNWAFLLVAAEWAIIVAIWKRWDRHLSWRIAAAFYLLVLAFLFRPLTAQVVNVPADWLTELDPWHEVISVPRVQIPILNDIVTQFVPWSHQVRESWRHLQIPLWNAAAGGGYPLLGNAQSGALSPIRLLMIPLPLGFSFAGEAALKLLLALTFGFLWAKGRGWSELASLVTALSFGFSTGLVVWLYFPHSTVVAFLPGLFYTIDRLLAKPSGPRVAAFGVIVAVTLLGGHPESSAHAFLAAGAWALFGISTMYRGRWKRRVAMLVVGGVIGLMLAGPFLAAFLESVPRSQRYDQLHHGAAPPSTPDDARFYVHLIQPRFFGEYSGPRWGPTHPEIVDGYAGMVGVAAWFALAVWLIRQRRWRDPAVFFVVAGFVAVAVAFEWPVIATIFDSVPPFSLSANARLRIDLCWFLAACAGAAVDLVRRESWKAWVPGLAFAVLALGAAFVLNRPHAFELSEISFETSMPGLLAISMMLPVGVRPRAPGLVALGLLGAIVIDLWAIGLRANPVVDASLLYPETPVIRELRALSASDPIGPSRIAGIDEAFFPNSAAIYGLEDVRAHDPMAGARWLGYLRVFTGYTSEKYFEVLSRLDHPIIDFMNVRYVITGPSERIFADGFRVVWSGDDGKIWINEDAAPRFFAFRRLEVESAGDRFDERLFALEDWTGTALLRARPPALAAGARPAPAKVETTRAGPGSYHLRIRASGPALIAGSLPFIEGWKVRRAGSGALDPLEVDGEFLGFVVPDGTSEVDVVYRPWTAVVGLVAACIGVALVLVLSWTGRESVRMDAAATAEGG